MGEDIVCDAYLEVYDNGSCFAQLLDLPGCYARGTTEAEALAALSSRIPAYYAWLSRHDDYTPEVHGPFRVVVAERVQVSATGAASRGAFFTPDLEPVTDGDLDWAAALLDWAYEDLCTCVATAVSAGGERAENAHAIAHNAVKKQLWLLTRIGADFPTASVDETPGGLVGQLRYISRLSMARLRATSEQEREQTLRLADEQWSLRKVLRRSILLARISTDVLEG